MTVNDYICSLSDAELQASANRAEENRLAFVNELRKRGLIAPKEAVAPAPTVGIAA